MKKSRLDVLSVEKGLFPTRQAAQTAIMDGAVLVDGQKITKPGINIPDSARIELIAGFNVPKYVSRGGLKLEKALDEFSIDPSGRICIDIGASTGGFTDCLLQRGANKVYAIDVGYGQLDWKLRSDARVSVHERVNARYLTPPEIYGHNDRHANLAVADVSFISLIKILGAAISLLEPDSSDLVFLVKPQFEAGRESVGKGGVVRDPSVHVSVIHQIVSAAGGLLLRARNLTYSPITGPAGNIEYLLHLANYGEDREIDTQRIVNDAFTQLGQ